MLCCHDNRYLIPQAASLEIFSTVSGRLPVQYHTMSALASLRSVSVDTGREKEGEGERWGERWKEKAKARGEEIWRDIGLSLIHI